MYLFSRSARVRPGSTRDAMSWAIEITDAVNHISDVQVELWSRTFSPGVGSLAWTTFVEDLAQLEATQDKLMADSAYVEAVDRGAQYVAAGPDDSLSTIVTGAPSTERSVEYVNVVHSVCAPGSLARGMDLGSQIAEKATAIGGNPCMFAMDATGAFGGVSWFTGFTDVGEMQRSESAVLSDPDFLAMLDQETPGVFADEPSATVQLCFRKLH